MIIRRELAFESLGERILRIVIAILPLAAAGVISPLPEMRYILYVPAKRAGFLRNRVVPREIILSPLCI